MANRGYVPFIILSSGRSGSNLIVSLLRSHPAVRCFGELLTIESKSVDFSVEGYDNNSAEDLRLRETDLIGFFQRRIYGEHPPWVRAVGFKPMYQHLPFFPELAHWLAAQPDLRVVHSKRRNLLRLFVSFTIATRSRQWIAPVTAKSRARERLWRKTIRLGLLPARLARRALRPRRPKPADSKTVAVTREECMFMFDWLRREEAEYVERFRNHPVLDIYYEDLIRDIPRAMLEVQDFLGLQPRALTVGTTRQNPEPLRELIANYDELREAFRGSEYAAFFDE